MLTRCTGNSKLWSGLWRSRERSMIPPVELCNVILRSSYCWCEPFFVSQGNEEMNWTFRLSCREKMSAVKPQSESRCQYVSGFRVEWLRVDHPQNPLLNRGNVKMIIMSMTNDHSIYLWHLFHFNRRRCVTSRSNPLRRWASMREYAVIRKGSIVNIIHAVYFCVSIRTDGSKSNLYPRSEFCPSGIGNSTRKQACPSHVALMSLLYSASLPCEEDIPQSGLTTCGISSLGGRLNKWFIYIEEKHVQRGSQYDWTETKLDIKKQK